jgi:hypothetical protein
MTPADICQLCEVYEEYAMSDSMVWRLVRHFNEGCENVHAVEEKIQENRRFTISSLSLHFPQISRSLLQKIVSDKLRFQKLCSRWVPKMLMEEHKMKGRPAH